MRWRPLFLLLKPERRSALLVIVCSNPETLGVLTQATTRRARAQRTPDQTMP